MARAFGLIAMLVALYVGLKIYAEGMEHVFGGLFAPIESVNERDPVATYLTPVAQDADAPTTRAPARRVPITEAVRDRVTSHLEEGARRRGN